MPLSLEAAREGAAYQVLFERCDPDSCTTPERLAFVTETCARAVNWASSEAPTVAAAYRGAAAQIVKRAADRLENHMRYAQLVAARKEMPEPPN